MNELLIVILIALGLILYFIAKRFMIVIGLGFIQYYVNRIAGFFGVGNLPFLNFDQELNNVIVALSTVLMGPLYGFVLIVLTIMIHFAHQEVASFGTVKEHVIRGSLILFIAMIMSGSPLIAVVLYSIFLSKIIYLVLDLVLFGAGILNMGKVKEFSSIGFYFILLRIF